MNQLKQPEIKLSHYTGAAANTSCIRCGAQDGTVVFAHYNGKLGQRFGRGMARKSIDFAGADLCHKCHAYFDTYGKDENGKALENDDARDAEFLSYCVLTTARREQQGVIEIVKPSDAPVSELEMIYAVGSALKNHEMRVSKQEYALIYKLADRQARFAENTIISRSERPILLSLYFNLLHKQKKAKV